jgi:cation:H+ antiporter
VFGLAVVGGAFLLSWVAEVAELDIPHSLAISVLAIIAVLPEYAIDVYLAWSAADVPENVHLVTANMTGANRLLIGIGWSFVVLLFWLRTRQRVLQVPRSHSVDLVILALATAYSFSIFIKGYLHVVDTVVLGSLFGLYIWLNFKGKVEEPTLVGPSALIGALPVAQRRALVVLIFGYAAAVIVLSAEPFVESLKGIGEEVGLSEFLLIQWLAPLASETPEVLLAAIFVMRGRAGDGISILISAKVSQWTLLVATLPAAFSISSGALVSLPLDSRQTTEFFLTSAQSLFAVAILIDLRISYKEAGVLFVLFISQLAFGLQVARLSFAFLYLLLTLIILLSSRERLTSVPRLFASAIDTIRSGPAPP